MNFIEQKIEWNGNGVVRIKERSMLHTVWRFCKRCERQLLLAIKGSAFKSSAIKGSVFKGAAIQRLSPVEELIIPDSQPQPNTQACSQQTQTLAHKPATVEIKMPQARSMGVLTEIRRYTAAEHASGESGGGRDDSEQSGLQQLLPALSGYCSDRWLVLVSPPQRPDVAALAAAGIDPSRVLLVHARGSSGLGDNGLDNGLDKGLKVVEQALQSGTCGAVVAWLEACDNSALQRLRRAAVTGQAWGVMFHEGAQDLALPAKTNSIAPVAIKVRRNLVQVSGAQIVDIYSGFPRPSAYLTKQVARQAQEKETIQLEMAIN